MLIKIYRKKIIIAITILILVLSLYIFPNRNTSNIQEKIEYVNYELNKSEIYLYDKNNYLARVMIPVKNKGNALIKEVIEILKCNSKYKDKIPNNFRCVLNENTKINNINLDNNTLKIDFNNSLLDTNNEEKTIEALIYTLTNIDNIKNVNIYIDGKLLNILPKTNITLPKNLNRNIGINKKYNLVSNINIKKTNIYYVNKLNNYTYYIPITLINNDVRDKIEIIIDELSHKLINQDLNSYLNNDIKLLHSEIKNDSMYVSFNNNILNDFDNNSILEEIIYTISLSINDNYNIKNIFFNVNDKEIVKTTIKSLE